MDTVEDFRVDADFGDTGYLGPFLVFVFEFVTDGAEEDVYGGIDRDIVE